VWHCQQGQLPHCLIASLDMEGTERLERTSYCLVQPTFLHFVLFIHALFIYALFMHYSHILSEFVSIHNVTIFMLCVKQQRHARELYVLSQIRFNIVDRLSCLILNFFMCLVLNSSLQWITRSQNYRLIITISTCGL